MPNIGDAVPPDHVPASTEELASIVGRNRIGFGAVRMNTPGRKAALARAKGRARSRRKPHGATQAAATAVNA